MSAANIGKTLTKVGRVVHSGSIVWENDEVTLGSTGRLPVGTELYAWLPGDGSPEAPIEVSLDFDPDAKFMFQNEAIVGSDPLPAGSHVTWRQVGHVERSIFGKRKPVARLDTENAHEGQPLYVRETR